MMIMAVTKKSTKGVRRSVTLSADVHHKVERLAREQKRSASRVLENLIESGLAAKEAERLRFFELAERFRDTKDLTEKQRLGEELGRMLFGS